MNYYKDLPRYVVAEKKEGKHILYIFLKSCQIIIIFITTIELFIKKKKKINNIKATLIRIIHHTYID